MNLIINYKIIKNKMRNKYKNLQNKVSNNGNSYVISEQKNHLNNNPKSNNINKNSFISNIDNREKIEKIMNINNDNEKKPFNEKRHASSFISNDKSISIKSSNHNIYYSIYKRENNDNSNKNEIKEINNINKNKIEHLKTKYYNLNRNVKINLDNYKDNKDNNKISKDNKNIITEVNSKHYNRLSTNKNYNSLNNNEKNYNKNNNNNNINKINIHKNLENHEYKRIKWDIKEQKLKILDKNTIGTINYNSTTNINNVSVKEKSLNNKRINYIKNKKKEEEIKKIEIKIKNGEKKNNSNVQSKTDIFSNKIQKKMTYRSKRVLNEEGGNEIKDVKNNNDKNDDKKNININNNNQKKKYEIKKYDNEIKNYKNNDNPQKLIKNEKYIKELSKTPNVINSNISNNEAKTEDDISKNNKFKRFFYFKTNQKNDNKDGKDKKENKEIIEKKVTKNINDNKDIENISNKLPDGNIKNNIKQSKEKKEINKNFNNKNDRLCDNEEFNKEKNVQKEKNIKKDYDFPTITTLSPIAQIQTESNISPELSVKSPQPQSIFKRINTYMYKMNKKHSFKDIIHEVNLNKDFHDSFTNMFQSCRNDKNEEKKSHDLNKSFSCFSNSNNELKLKLDDNNMNNIFQYLKVNLNEKKSSDIIGYDTKTNLKKLHSPSNNLIYKKKMNLIKTISTQYKKSIPNFIFNSINNVNNKRNSDLTYGNIINNNTYNTTLNIFTNKNSDNKQNLFDINNISEIKHKKHIRTNSELQENRKLFYSPILINNEKENNSHKKNKSISNNLDLSEIMSNNYNNKEIKYKINLEILYIIESKMHNILSKVNNYIICPNECFDLITYYFSSKFYEKEIKIFMKEKNRAYISNYIKLELLCYFLCYDICFNKSFNQTGILLKTIFNLLYNDYLILVSYILNESEKSFEDNLINNEYSMKLKNVINNNINMKLPKQNLDENFVISLLGNNLKQVSNYYKMIIDNLYSHFYLKKNNEKNYNDIKYKFPHCLQLDIDNLDHHEKLNIISLFFFDGYNNLLNNHKFEDMKYFFDSFLQRISQIKDNKKTKNKIKNRKNKLLSYSNTTKNIKNVVIYKYNYNNGFYYLPPIKSYYKYTLVLDLDETLIYLMPNNIYLTESGKIGETRHSLIFRPGLIDFLKKMKNLYELIIFSFGTLEYVDSVIKIIEKKEKFFEHILYRQHATVNNGEYVKDLSLLGRNLKNIIIVDDICQAFKLQEKNGICIKAFYGDIVSDRNTLKILGKILEQIRFDADEDGDIRKSLEKQRDIIFSHITNSLD